MPIRTPRCSRKILVLEASVLLGIRRSLFVGHRGRRVFEISNSNFLENESKIGVAHTKYSLKERMLGISHSNDCMQSSDESFVHNNPLVNCS